MPWDPPLPWLYGGGYYIWEPTPWGEGARVMGAGGSPRQCAINLKRGLPTAPILGGAEGGFAGGYREDGSKAEGEAHTAQIILALRSSAKYRFLVERPRGRYRERCAAEEGSCGA